MIGIFLFLISFFIFASTGALGGDIIYALDVVEIFYWIICAIIVVLAMITTFSLTAVGASKGRALFGYTSGIILSIFMLVKIGVQLWLTIWLIGSIDPMATTFTILESKELFGLAVLFILSVVGPKTRFKF